MPDLIDYNRNLFHLSSSAASNLLFVESPAGVGWSYSNTTSDYTTGDAKTGTENCEPPNYVSLNLFNTEVFLSI